ncbi:MAG: citrate synthase [Streptosporangiaceae bacterium]
MTDTGSDGTAQLRTAAGTAVSLPSVHATAGSPGVDISKLLSTAGVITYDPGFRNTGACRSEITYIDGDVGVLRYRGYPIEQLAEHSTFLEVSYLLIHGGLPTADQLGHFEHQMRSHAALPAGYLRLFDGFRADAHPMTVLSAAVTALSAYYQDSLDPLDPGQVEEVTVALLAQMPTMAAYFYNKSLNRPCPDPDPALGMVENFLQTMFSQPGRAYQVDPAIAQALDMLFVLHGDHEQNCSASTVRLVGSARADLFVSVAAGINALIGPLHGGANSAVMHMLEDIRADGGNVRRFVDRVKAKEKGARLMGFGHAVYHNYDPRAAIIKKTADQVISATSGHDDLLDIAMELEACALSDDYFVSRNLYPNVDFYTGLLYRAMGFPTNMFTVLFALGRLPGWIAQWREMIGDPDTKIGRPRQIYTGPAERQYVPIAFR